MPCKEAKYLPRYVCIWSVMTRLTKFCVSSVLLDFSLWIGASLNCNLVKCQAIGTHLFICSISFLQSATASSWSVTIWSMRPIFIASETVYNLPLSKPYSASRWPVQFRNESINQKGATSPNLASLRPIVNLSLATIVRKSQQEANRAPPAGAWPFMAAPAGTLRLYNLNHNSCRVVQNALNLKKGKTILTWILGYFLTNSNSFCIIWVLFSPFIYHLPLFFWLIHFL